MNQRSSVDPTTQSREQKTTSWTQRLWDKILLFASLETTLDSKVPLDKFVNERPQSLLWCKSYIKHFDSGIQGGIGLVIRCSVENKFPGSEDYQLIGGNTQPFLIDHGRVQICLKTSCLEADQENGEGDTLCKDWQFKGQSSEWQFLLKLKNGFRLGGIMGKIIFTTVHPSGNSETIGEFNLCYPEESQLTTTPVSTDDAWLSLGYRELAESLGILNEDSTTIDSLCHELGFTDHESDSIQSSDDPFLSLMTKYRSRHGTPREFIQKIYQCKRRSYINPFTNGCNGELQLQAQISDISTATVQVSGGTEQDVEEDLTEAACLLHTPPRRKRHLADVGGIIPKKPCLRLDFTDRGTVDNDKECDAETLPAEDLEMYVFPPTPRKFDIPPTPPLTPLKRLTSLARDRKSINNKGGDIFVFPEKVE